MESKYLIQDTREVNDFKKCTFSGYKKTEVLTEYVKACEDNKLENALCWLTEIHCSHYLPELFEKIFLIISNKIHLNSYYLPTIVYNHFLFWQDQKERNEATVNNQKLRNSLFEITALLIQCNKHRHLPKKKIIKDNDFNINKITSLITCSTNHISPNIIKTNDPKILTLVFNEFSYCITKHQDLQGKIQDKKGKNREYYMDKAVYWLCWIHKWDTIQKKNGGSHDCSEREVTNISKEDSRDIIWICWAVIMAECQRRTFTDICVSQVVALFNMYKFNFTRSKKMTRLPILIHTLALLILDDANISETVLTHSLVIQGIMKCNLFYKNIKKFECTVKKTPLDFSVIQPEKEIKESKTNKKQKISESVQKSLMKFDLVMKIDRMRLGY